MTDTLASQLECSNCEAVWPVKNGIPRFTDGSHYTSSFSYQWNKFDKTQLDTHSGVSHSRDRLFGETLWVPDELEGKNILEVGAGAGRFSEIILADTKANLVCIDSSGAIDQCASNNHHYGERIQSIQASIDQMPFNDAFFDKVLCLGVLQHTADIQKTIQALVNATTVGGEVVVDFYVKNGWWTLVQAKYLVRPITKRIAKKQLLKIIRSNIDWMLYLHRLFARYNLRYLSRLLPIVDIDATFPPGLSLEQTREWAILDTFDMLSPEHDKPQRIKDIAVLFEECGTRVTFAGKRMVGSGSAAAVVTAIKV